MSEQALERRSYLVAAGSAAMVVLLGAVLVLSSVAGCSSRPEKAVIPDAANVPKPSTEPGVVPDQDKMKRVKID